MKKIVLILLFLNSICHVMLAPPSSSSSSSSHPMTLRSLVDADLRSNPKGDLVKDIIESEKKKSKKKVTFEDNPDELDLAFEDSSESPKERLRLAIHNGNAKDVFKVFEVHPLHRKLKINGRYFNGMTPLQYAAWKGDVSVVRELMMQGANPFLKYRPFVKYDAAKDFEHTTNPFLKYRHATAIQIAEKEKKTDIVRYLQNSQWRYRKRITYRLERLKAFKARKAKRKEGEK